MVDGSVSNAMMEIAHMATDEIGVALATRESAYAELDRLAADETLHGFEVSALEDGGISIHAWRASPAQEGRGKHGGAHRESVAVQVHASGEVTREGSPDLTALDKALALNVEVLNRVTNLHREEIEFHQIIEGRW